MRRKYYLGGLLVFLFFLFFAAAPSIAEGAGWVTEAVGQDGAVFNFEKYPLDNYSLDFYVDTSWNWLPWKWGEGIGDAVIYGLYAITNVVWILNVYVCYFLGYLVQEAFDLDFITSLVSSLATNMQKIGGIDGNGLRATGLFPSYGVLIIVVFGCYIAYVGAIKQQATRAIQHTLVFAFTFIASGVFLMNANSYLTSINNAQKEINTEMLTIAKDIIPSASTTTIETTPTSGTEQEQRTKAATNAIRENLFELQVYTPYMLLQYGESSEKEIGKDRIDKLLNESQFTESERNKNVENEVNKLDNMNMSVKGAFLRFGMTILVIGTNLVIGMSVLTLTIIMIFSQVLFLLFCAMLPVAMVFSLFPNSNKILFSAMQKIVQNLLTKMGITLILAVTFSLSHSFYSLSKDKGYIWVVFLQIAVWLTVKNRVNELLSFMKLGNAETKPAGRLGRMAKGLLMAGTARGLMKRATNPRANQQQNRQSEERRQQQKQQRKQQSKQSFSKSIGQKLSNIQDMPNNVVEKANNIKDSVKNAPQNAKHKALEARDNYTDGRMNQEIKNNESRSNRQTARKNAQQQRNNALRASQQRKQNLARNQMSSAALQSVDASRLKKEQNALRSTRSQSDGKHRVSVPVAKASFDKSVAKKVPYTNAKEQREYKDTAKASYKVSGHSAVSNRNPRVPVYFENDPVGKEKAERFNQNQQERRLKRQAGNLGIKERPRVEQFVKHRQTMMKRGGKR
ncbi:CD3337/EF1877 family mobilome membrane protein [Candidatus Enterococcus clewellii]|uniref:Conjugative transposon protein n=1 Tax=Candidatus Enterococcus clewellii TaxID=1834193 RepID=A0A242KA58_9ENTE|nr:hypothetical protein [Enterococcus sp. 9E7_DIV0242]OTP17430.1 hypothetical protein A5888_001568 [Enterococcus sp. 9E7_DIV0242]